MFKILSIYSCWKKYIKCNIWKVVVRPSYIQDARFLKVKTIRYFTFVFHFKSFFASTYTLHVLATTPKNIFISYKKYNSKFVYFICMQFEYMAVIHQAASQVLYVLNGTIAFTIMTEQVQNMSGNVAFVVRTSSKVVDDREM